MPTLATSWKWTCGIDGDIVEGFESIDAAAADAQQHFADNHAGTGVSPSFSYESTNNDPPPTPPPTPQELWDQIPNDTPLTKELLGPVLGLTTT